MVQNKPAGNEDLFRAVEATADSVEIARLRDRIARANTGLVYHFANRYRKRCHTWLAFEDLVSAGMLALSRAILRFQVSRGWKFSTYAGQAIQREIWREIVSAAKEADRAITERTNNPAMDAYSRNRRVPAATTEAPDSFDEVCKAVSNGVILTERERGVLALRWPVLLGRRSNENTLEDVAPSLGVTKERIRQIQEVAFAKIRLVMGDE